MNRVVRKEIRENKDKKSIQRHEGHWLYRRAKWLIGGILGLPKALWSIPKKLVKMKEGRMIEAKKDFFIAVEAVSKLKMDNKIPVLDNMKARSFRKKIYYKLHGLQPSSQNQGVVISIDF